MWFTSWLRNGSWRRPPRGGTPPRLAATRFRPRLEALEDRWLPSQIGLTVSSLADSGPGTLRAAILTADAGSQADKFTIGFTVSGTVVLQSPLPDLNNSITIQGPGASSLTVERAAGASFASAIITVDADQAARLSKLTIANGDDGGIANNGTLTVNRCTIFGNFGSNGGGISNFGTLTVRNSLLAANSVSHDGGGIWNTGILEVSNSILSGNVANEDAGGAIFNFAGRLTVRASTISDNSAAVGGGVYNQVFGSATIQQSSTLSGNSAEDGGGIVNAGTLTVRDSTLCGNSVSDRGGGIENFGTTTLRNSTLLGNTAGSAGGGVENAASGTLAVNDSTVLNNVAPLGADLDNLGALTLKDSTVGVISP